MLDAWQTGHPGSVATLHATSPEGALLRLDLLCQRANVPSQIALIAEAVQLIVQTELRARRGGVRPTITQIVHVAGLDPRRRFLLHRVGGLQDDPGPQQTPGNGRNAPLPSRVRPARASLSLDAGA
jgi:hypothetical protein